MMTRIAAIVLALVFFIALPVLASPPVPPPVEVDTISTVTDIQCIGTVLEAESYTRRWIGATDGDPGPQFVGTATVPFGDMYIMPPNNGNHHLPYPYAVLPLIAPASDVGGPGRDPVLGAGDTAGEIRYEEEFNAVNGQTTYNKIFDTDTAGTPDDLDVDKTFTFVANGTVSPTTLAVAPTAAALPVGGNLSFNERVGMTIVSNGFDVADAAPPVTDVIGGLCPWVQDPGGTIIEIPATNESVAMGSEILSASAVAANTATSVGASVETPNASYAVNAQGQGFIEASMAVQVQEGFGKVGWAPGGLPVMTTDTAGLAQHLIDILKNKAVAHVQPAQVVAPGLALFEQYEEVSSADGQWTFSKSMAYESRIPVLQIPAVF